MENYDLKTTLSANQNLIQPSPAVTLLTVATLKTCNYFKANIHGTNCMAINARISLLKLST